MTIKEYDFPLKSKYLQYANSYLIVSPNKLFNHQL